MMSFAETVGAEMLARAISIAGCRAPADFGIADAIS
jgi:hypothetical protein